MAYLPGCLPGLPDPTDGTNWSGNVLSAYTIILDSYQQAYQLLQQPRDVDPMRRQIHYEKLYHDTIPLFESLQDEVQNNDWQDECSQLLIAVASGLEMATPHRSYVSVYLSQAPDDY
jgi:hypothetical protein